MWKKWRCENFLDALYVDHFSQWCKSSQLLVCFGVGRRCVATSKSRISIWVRDAILLWGTMFLFTARYSSSFYQVCCFLSCSFQKSSPGEYLCDGKIVVFYKFYRFICGSWFPVLFVFEPAIWGWLVYFALGQIWQCLAWWVWYIVSIVSQLQSVEWTCEKECRGLLAWPMSPE